MKKTVLKVMTPESYMNETDLELRDDVVAVMYNAHDGEIPYIVELLKSSQCRLVGAKRDDIVTISDALKYLNA